MKKKNRIIGFLFLSFILVQFFRPQQIDRGTSMKSLTGVPKEVNVILKNSCFDCHSSEVSLKWYDQITPANFIVNSHIRKGSEALDFSKWDSLAKPQQNATMYYSINKILSGEMPLPSYAIVHSNAQISHKDLQVLKDYVLSLSPRKYMKNVGISSQNNQNNRLHKTNNVEKSSNGLNYISGYRNWKAISTTDRFDNGTMRIIFGNDIAVKAIQDHNINPWPNGTVFAKAAWKQDVHRDGSVSAGEFVQVEFMVKDSKKYSDTKGWGWGRWKGMNLKPYGEKPDFDKECIECHKPMENRDYTFTSPLYLISQLKKIQKK